MSNEAAAQAEPAQAEPVTPSEATPTIDVVHDVGGAVERQRARLAAAKVQPVTPTPAQAPQGTPAPAPAGAVEIEIDVPDEQALLEDAKKRLAEREQRAPIEHMTAKLAALEKRLEQLPSGPALPIASLKTDDPAAVAAALKSAGLDPDALIKTLAKGKLAPSVADQLGALIDAKLAPLLQRMAPEGPPQDQQPDAQISIDEVKGIYAAYIEGAAGRWPYLDAKREELGSDMVADLVLSYARQLARQGVNTRTLTDEQLSAMFVKKFAPAPASASPPGAPTASGGQHTQSPGTSSASGGPTRTSAPRTVTAGLAANAAPAKPPTTDQERYQRAVERRRARLNSA